jgi:D-glycero-D-manno-heptose 1,7-bisphosphate phosphatase
VGPSRGRGRKTIAERIGRRAVFVDRDGTLIPDFHYLADPEAVVLLPGVGEALRSLREHGYVVICITNQSGIARGFYTDAIVAQIHERVNHLLEPFGTQVDAFYYCPHHPDQGCDCRKPGIALFRQAAQDWNVDLPVSSIVGDRELDIAAGRRLGLFTVLVPEADRADAVERELLAQGLSPDARAASMQEAAALILARDRSRRVAASLAE